MTTRAKDIFEILFKLRRVVCSSNEKQVAVAFNYYKFAVRRINEIVDNYIREDKYFPLDYIRSELRSIGTILDGKLDG